MVVGIIATTLFGVVFTGIGLYSYYNKKELMRKAEPVEAEILDTRIRKEHEPGDDDIGYNYYPKVRYEYYVDGTKYQSTSVYPGGEEAKQTESAAREVIEPYSEGKRVEAHVSPDDPGVSFLEETAAWKSLIFVPFGLASFVIAGWMALG